MYTADLWELTATVWLKYNWAFPQSHKGEAEWCSFSPFHESEFIINNLSEWVQTDNMSGMFSISDSNRLAGIKTCYHCAYR